MNRAGDRATATDAPGPWRVPAFWFDLAVKAALVGLLLLALVRPDLPQYRDKAMAARAATYPLSALVVPIAWSLAGRRRGAYPYAVDILLTLPFLIDTVGNALNLFDTVSWWDDANHFVNWAILTAAAGQWLLRRAVGRWTLAALATGFGAVSAILWELAEYVAFVRNSPELATAYTDTLGDLALGLSGSTLAAIGTAVFLWSRPQPPR